MPAGKVRNYLPQVLATIAVTLSSASDGITYGWTSPVLPKLKAPDSAIKVTDADGEWLELLYMLGGIAGLPIIVSVVDRVGRKKAILFANSCSLLSWILIATATNVQVLYVARFISGMQADVAFVAVPMYIGELVEKQIRGFLTSFINIMVLIGVLICYSVAPFVSVTSSAAVGASFVVLQLLMLPWMPETPYFLLMKGDVDKAEKSLKWTRRKEDVQKELQEIQSAVERQSSERGRFQDLFIVPSNRKAIIIMAVLNAAQHLSSISIMMMNIHTILKDAEGVIESNTACIIFASIMLLAGLVGAGIIDKFGRKVLLITSNIFASASLGGLAVYLTCKHMSFEVSLYNWVPILGVFVYAASYRLGIGLVPIVITAEIFPTSVKAFGMTFSDAMFVIFASATIYMYQVVEHHVGMHVPFYIFSISCILNIFFIYFYIPETKGKTLEEIQMILKGIKPGDNEAPQVNGKPMVNLSLQDIKKVCDEEKQANGVKKQCERLEKTLDPKVIVENGNGTLKHKSDNSTVDPTTKSNKEVESENVDTKEEKESKESDNTKLSEEESNTKEDNQTTDITEERKL